MVVAANMCIGPEGDLHGVSPAECAVRMAKAGEFTTLLVSISILDLCTDKFNP